MKYFNKYKNKITNCPNCNAPIKHGYNHNCEYCGTWLQVTDEKIEKVKSDYDLTDIEVKFEKNFLKDGYDLVIYAKTIPKAKWFHGYNQITSETLFTIDGELYNKIGYKLFMPANIFIEGNIENYIKNSLPPFLKEHIDLILYEIDKKYLI